MSTGNPTFNTFLAQQLATVSSAYPIGTMDSSQNPQLPSLTPTNFQFQVLTTPSKVVLLQLYIVTNGTAQPQLSLHDVPEPVPAGYDCSLLISSRILFRDVLPASFKKSIFVMTGVDPKDPHKPWTATSSPASIPVPLVNLGDELRANSPVTVSLAGLNISAGTQRPTYPLGLTQSSSFRVPFQNRYCEARYKTMCLSFAWADRSVDVTTQINTTLPIAITGSGEDQQPGAGIRGQRAGRLRHCQRPVQRRQLAGGHRRFLSRRRATGHQGGRRRVISRDLVPGAQEPAVPGRKHGQHVHEPMRPATWSFSATSCHLPDRDGDRGGRSARIGPRLSFHLGPAARRLDTARRDPAQNPRISAGALSPVSAIFDAVVERISAGHDLTGIVSEAQRARMLRAMFDAYYAEFAHPVIFDTCRSWTARLPTLVRLFPTAKLICCVRDVAWIMDSIERQFRSSGFEYTALFKSEAERSSVYTRLETLAHANRMVGYPWHALREACFSDFAERLMLVDYELLASRPAEVLPLIYDFIGEPAFSHDYDHVTYDAPELDIPLGLPSQHRVRGPVRLRPHPTILPPDLFQRYAQLSFWRDLKDSRAYKVAMPAEAAAGR